ncbi:helix-turn-helix transcriptional regulator [Planctomicrobium sp. SH661]|uniref:helix-turn-helix transcriptional regulator n=1 Tax=Planctomicrobium sp. SH661 TaxID=3448124 RepID=UPI003F5C69AF
MKTTKRKKLEAAGWKVGSTTEFLGLGEAEEMLVEMKLALANKVRELRQFHQLTQVNLAKLIGSSQSRIAKLETADPSISMELLIRSLAKLGVTRGEIGEILSHRPVAKKKSTRRKESA